MSRPVPNLSHAKLAVEQLVFFPRDPLEYGLIVMLYADSAGSRVWTMSEPTDGGISLDRIHRLVGMTKRQWAKHAPLIAHWFTEKDGKWYPARPAAIEIQIGTNRPAIPSAIRSAIMQRDQFRCQYCGDTDGPFDIDHIVPIIQGGDALAEENLVCACANCNRSKGGRTVEEWMGR